VNDKCNCYHCKNSGVTPDDFRQEAKVPRICTETEEYRETLAIMEKLKNPIKVESV